MSTISSDNVRMYRKRAAAWFSVLALSATLILPASAARADTDLVDVTANMVGLMKPCFTATELDCIQDVSTVSADGTATSLNRISDSAIPKYAYGTGQVGARVELESPAHVIFGTQIGSAMRVFIEGLQPTDRTRFQLKIRTSWLKPEDIQLLADNATYSEAAIKGGTLWTFAGSQQTIGGYDGDWQTKMKNGANADVEWQRLTFFVHHAGIDAQHSYFDPRCAKLGYPVRVFNAPGAGLPYWDEANQSLNFGIEAPHADPRGVPYVGYFKLWVPTAYIDCMYPSNSVTNAVSIQVIIKDGTSEQDVADTTIKRANGLITVVANNFHYSSPVIQIKAVKASPGKPVTGSNTDTQPKTTITCVKGKLTKKVTAVSPKCPTGYKKKA